VGRVLASLRSRVFAATALVAVLPMGAAVGYVTVRATHQAEAELGRQLEEAARIVEEHHRVLLEIGRERALLMADVPMLKAAVDTGDPPTVRRLVRDYPERVGCDVFIVTGPDGRVLAALGGTLGGTAALPSRQGFAVEGGRLVEYFTVPIVLGAGAPEVLGELTLGFVLDDDVVSRLRSLTGSHVVVVHQGQVRATTLPIPLDASLLETAGVSGVSRLRLGGEDWVGLRQPLVAGDEGPSVVVLKSRAEALRPLDTLRTALAIAALVAVVVSLLLSWAVARTVTRPLAALTDTMKEIAVTGDLTREIGPGRPWDDEDARLLSRTFNTLTESIARFQRESAMRDRLSALGRLSTILAHEVRNPLMIIRGSLRTLRREGARPEDVREATGDIDHEVTRLDRIVGDVLDFARPLKIEPAPTELGPLCRDAARAALEGADGVELRHAFDPGLGRAPTDGERLRTVLVNLVANARDSVLARRETGAGSPEGDGIEVGGRRLEDDRVLLWVADAGVGISAADLPHVFDPYFTTKRTGTGLGLAIARKVVEALGGVIRVESREGEGTRIEVELPASAPEGRTQEAP
jgi:signal transduction histidine kinase